MHSQERLDQWWEADMDRIGDILTTWAPRVRNFDLLVFFFIIYGITSPPSLLSPPLLRSLVR